MTRRFLITNGALVDSYSLQGFDTRNRPGTWDSCTIRNRFDYTLLSGSLATHFHSGEAFREGLWGARSTRRVDWPTYPEMADSSMRASDHAALFVDINI